MFKVVFLCQQKESILRNSTRENREKNNRREEVLYARTGEKITEEKRCFTTFDLFIFISKQRYSFINNQIEITSIYYCTQRTHILLFSTKQGILLSSF